MRFLKIIGILAAGLLVGILGGLIAFAFFIPQEAGQPAYADAANGMAMILFVVGGLTISVPFSVLFAVWSWRKSRRVRASKVAVNSVSLNSTPE